MARRAMIRLAFANVLVMAVAVLSRPAAGHCVTGLPCVFDPTHTHGGDVSPEVKQYTGALQNAQRQAGSVVIQRVFTVPKIQAPLDPQTQRPGLPEIGVPPGLGARPPKTLTSTPDGEKPLSVAPPPLTPAEFARQGLPVQSAADFNMVARGVMDGTRELLNAGALERIMREAPDARAGRVMQNNIANVSQTLEKLRAYNKIMQDAKERARTGRLDPNTRNVLTDLEYVYRHTQEIIQVPEGQK